MENIKGIGCLYKCIMAGKDLGLDIREKLKRENRVTYVRVSPEIEFNRVLG